LAGIVASHKKATEASDTKVVFIAINKSIKKTDLWIGHTGASTNMKCTIDGIFDLHKEKIL
jgi:hypothetical protein